MACLYYEETMVYGCLVNYVIIKVSSSHPLCFRVYSHMTKQFTQSLPAVFGAHLAVLEGEWSRKELIECKNESKIMTGREVKRWEQM